jgi:hypothetical protein
MKQVIALSFLALILGSCTFLALILGAFSSSPQKVSLEPSNEYPPPGTIVEKVVDLGYGFQRVYLGEPYGKTEIFHYTYLYYGKQRLSQVDRCSVSPSGKHVIYHDAPSGCLFLFTPAATNLLQLTKKYVGYAESFQWHEEANRVDVFVNKSWRPKRTFPIE